MSHFSTVRIQIKQGDTLQEVLTDLGYDIECNTTVRGYQGDTLPADYVIRQSNGFDLGFRFNGETYELVTDLWGARINQTEFINSIHRNYAHKMLMRTVLEQGFNVEEEDVMEDGTVRVVVGRWV